MQTAETAAQLLINVHVTHINVMKVIFPVSVMAMGLERNHPGCQFWVMGDL
jgi:hypothetical protein